MWWGNAKVSDLQSRKGKDKKKVRKFVDLIIVGHHTMISQSVLIKKIAFHYSVDSLRITLSSLRL
jgi:hypothetical protein